VSKCICEGNWRNIIADYEPLFGSTYIDSKGVSHTLAGIMDGGDDYYYVMQAANTKTAFLTCVGELEDMGFTPVVKQAVPEPATLKSVKVVLSDSLNRFFDLPLTVSVPLSQTRLERTDFLVMETPFRRADLDELTEDELIKCYATEKAKAFALHAYPRVGGLPTNRLVIVIAQLDNLISNHL
jgi:hypothetical protein